MRLSLVPGSVARSVSRPVRRSVVIPCQVVRERDFTLVGRQVLDLSEEGMLVRADARVLTGEPVIVTFLAPFSRIWIDAEAFVARVIHGRRPHDRGRELGLSFEHVDATARARFHRELGWFRPVSARGRAAAACG
jgi:hypothetical protein